MKLLIVSLRTTGLLKEMFEEYCLTWSKMVDLYCITNDNVSNKALGTNNCLHLHYRRKEPFSYLSIKKIKRAKKFIKSVNPDIVLYFSPHPDNIPLIAYTSRYRLMAQIHNPIPHTGTKITERFISEVQKRLYFKYCDRIFVSGEKLKQDLISIYKVDANKIISKKFAALSNLLVDSEGAVNEEYDIIFFGRIEPYKGLDVLIEALKHTRKPRRCLIVGKGKPYFDVSDKEADITFINEFVPDDKLAALIKKSKVVVMPYRDATGTSTVIQAFAFGKPVIATDVGVFPEYVADGGMIVPNSDFKELAHAIDTLLDDDEMRRGMGQNGLNYLKDEFDIEQFCRFYIDEFKKTLA